MEIKQIDSETKGTFKIEESGITAGRMTYSSAGNNKFIIGQTEVNPDFRGKNIGKQWLMAAVNFVRETNVKIIPLYPFAKSVFEKTN
jgi:predicted GNAT family acetyltransferase